MGALPYCSTETNRLTRLLQRRNRFRWERKGMEWLAFLFMAATATGEREFPLQGGGPNPMRLPGFAPSSFSPTPAERAPCHSFAFLHLLPHTLFPAMVFCITTLDHCHQKHGYLPQFFYKVRWSICILTLKKINIK